MNILVINAGSSSLKYQLMNPETGDVSAKGLCERIGIDGRLTHKVGDAKTVDLRNVSLIWEVFFMLQISLTASFLSRVFAIIAIYIRYGA